jgi:hypothetical protein
MKKSVFINPQRIIAILGVAVLSATVLAQESIPQTQARPGQAAIESNAFDWPNWRGPAHDGVSKETKLNWKWPLCRSPELIHPCSFKLIHFLAAE